MNIIQKAQQLVFVVRDNVTLLVLDHLDVFVLLPKGFSFSLSPHAVHCSSEEHLNLLRGKFSGAAVHDLLPLYAESSMERCIMSKHTGISVALHLNGATMIFLPPVHPLPTLMGKRCPTLAFPNKYTQQCQTNILFVQRQHFVYENITTIKHKATTKKTVSAKK